MKPLSAIYLDMDGVLVDFVGGVFRLYELDPNLRREVKGWDGIPSVLSVYSGREISDAVMWQEIAKAGAAFWEELAWLPWGREVYMTCAAKAPTVLMTTPSPDPSSAAGKVTWIHRNMPPGQRFALAGKTPKGEPGSCKHHMAHPGALLIDDGQHNVDQFTAHHGDALLIPAPWNDSAQWPTQADVLTLVSATLSKYSAV